MRDHHDADRRSLALHAEVARRVRVNPDLRDRAREPLSFFHDTFGDLAIIRSDVAADFAAAAR